MVSFGLLLSVILNSGIRAPFLFRPQRFRIIFSTYVTAIFDPCSLAESCRCLCRCPQDCFAVGDFAAAIDASRYCADHAAPLGHAVISATAANLPCAVAAVSGAITMVSAGTAAYFFVTMRSTTRLSSPITMLLMQSRPTFTKLSASGRVVGRISPRCAASWRLPDHDVGTGRSMVISARTGVVIGGLPFIASWAARRPWASYLRVAAGV